MFKMATLRRRKLLAEKKLEEERIANLKLIEE
jgi:hypothetical protein